MSDNAAIAETVRAMCLERLGVDDLKDDEEFFDRGANSLTVVELQIQLEKKLELKVPTSTLMASPSIEGWIGVYSQAAEQAKTAAE
ncbi:MAG: acyl carrier protein [Azospirillaceae bacterium]